ncbi:MAG TPA: DUF1648 domain-containing protein [Drouetiella sp.]
MTLSVLCATISVVYCYWSVLPEQVVVHFDIFGAPDHYGPKSTLLMLCGMSVFNFLLMSILSYFPHTFNYLRPITESNAAHQYLLARKFIFVMNLEVTGIMFFAIWSCIQVTIGAAKSLDMVSMLTLLVAILISSAVYTFRASRA